ncbi:hypothetical protein [Halalkalibacter flavus]|uniref:hypothetical protein n=1 Tax=Halalkalibacter flavus TaxID=3090668 RepID=UPI002FC72FA6
MSYSKKSKEQRKREKEILHLYHKKLTEDELDPLYESFVKWKKGELPYDELTEYIHEFHKKNQKIWSWFNYGPSEKDFMLMQAKKKSLVY